MHKIILTHLDPSPSSCLCVHMVKHFDHVYGDQGHHCRMFLVAWDMDAILSWIHECAQRPFDLFLASSLFRTTVTVAE